MKVIECIEKRHSTRAFSQRVVERDKLEQIVRCGVLAPTGRNTQALRFVVLQKKEDMDVFLKYCKHVLKTDTSPYYGANAIIFVFADMGKAVTPLQDAAAALENMLLAATELGLGSYWIHSASIRYFKTLQGKEHKRIWGLENFECLESCAIGYAGDDFLKKEKEEKIVRFI